MSANFLNVFEDENPDLHKQFGCISGIFQVFDRQHLLSKRRFGGQSQKALPLGNLSSESNVRSPKTVLIKNPSHNENHRTSEESSRTSFSSSSCSSSFSSLECNKSTQHESSIFDFRDVVKGTLYRETHGLSVKTEAPKEVKKVVAKNKDSPRPLPLSKSKDCSYAMTGKSQASVDLDESPSFLAKLKQGPSYFSEPRESPKTSIELKPKEVTRFSCDGREVSRTSLDSRERRISAKLKETPRFSLDSMQSSMTEAERRDSNQRILRTLALHQDLGDNRQSPSVVAKLMGLEAMPTHGKDCDGIGIDVQKRDGFPSHSPRVAQEFKQDWPSSPKMLTKEAIPPQRTGPHSRIPIETAPWSPQERSQEPLKKQESVYGEIARKLNELEFQQCNKDLRALKQILDAIKAKGLLEANKGEEKPPQVSCQKAYSHRTMIARDPSSISVDGRFQQGSRNHLDSPIVIMKPAKSINKCSSLPSTSKPFGVPTGNSTESKRCSVNNRQAKDRSPRNIFRDGDVQIHDSTEKKPGSPRCRQSPGVINVKSSSSSSPRMQQKKLVLEKKCRLEANNQKKQARQPSESVSPRAKLAVKPKVDQKLLDVRNLSHQGDGISQRSDSNISSASHVLDIEVTGSDQSPKLDFALFHGNRSPMRVAVGSTGMIAKHKDSRNFGEDCISAERGASANNQPSPVSVLNASFYRDELPASPVDGSSFSCGDEEDRNVGDIACGDEWSPVAASKDLPNILIPDEVDLKKLRNVASLVQKLDQPGSTNDDESETYRIDLLCETKNPDHRYISEVLLASGLLLEDLSNGFQLRNTGYAINPKLFLVLEQKMYRNASKLKVNIEKIHRKLIFDTINEVLAEKFELIGPGTKLASCLHSGKIAHRVPSDKHLLKELCLEIEYLETVGSRASGPALEDEEEDGLKLILSHDIARQNEGWSGNGREVSGLVLDIERSIFKDLIDEVVSGEAVMSLQARSRRCRQLLAK